MPQQPYVALTVLLLACCLANQHVEGRAMKGPKFRPKISDRMTAAHQAVYVAAQGDPVPSPATSSAASLEAVAAAAQAPTEPNAQASANSSHSSDGGQLPQSAEKVDEWDPAGLLKRARGARHDRRAAGATRGAHRPFSRGSKVSVAFVAPNLNGELQQRTASSVAAALQAIGDVPLQLYQPKPPAAPAQQFITPKPILQQQAAPQEPATASGNSSEADAQAPKASAKQPTQQMLHAEAPISADGVGLKDKQAQLSSAPPASKEAHTDQSDQEAPQASNSPTGSSTQPEKQDPSSVTYMKKANPQPAQQTDKQERQREADKEEVHQTGRRDQHVAVAAQPNPDQAAVRRDEELDRTSKDRLVSQDVEEDRPSSHLRRWQDEDSDPAAATRSKHRSRAESDSSDPTSTSSSSSSRHSDRRAAHDTDGRSGNVESKPSTAKPREDRHNRDDRSAKHSRYSEEWVSYREDTPSRAAGPNARSNNSLDADDEQSEDRRSQPRASQDTPRASRYDRAADSSDGVLGARYNRDAHDSTQRDSRSMVHNQQMRNTDTGLISAAAADNEHRTIAMPEHRSRQEPRGSQQFVSIAAMPSRQPSGSSSSTDSIAQNTNSRDAHLNPEYVHHHRQEDAQADGMQPISAGQAASRQETREVVAANKTAEQQEVKAGKTSVAPTTTNTKDSRQETRDAGTAPSPSPQATGMQFLSRI